MEKPVITIRRFDSAVTDYTDEANYSILWMMEGFESISIDFKELAADANSIYFAAPGRVVRLAYADQPLGWIISFSASVFNDMLGDDLVIRDVDIFNSFGVVPKIILSPRIGERVTAIAEMIDELGGSTIPHRDAAIMSLLKTLLIYCDSRCNIRIRLDSSDWQIHMVTLFKSLVATHYAEHHLVGDYASMMNITPKYLNHVVKEVLGVTAKSVIQEQLTIQARRELKFSNSSVKEIAFRLGFSEPFYFSNYFKKQVGCSPTDYRAS